MSCVVCAKTSTDVCGACLQTAYCSTSCQTTHWHRQHKIECIGRRTFEPEEDDNSKTIAQQTENILLQFQKDTKPLESLLKKAGERSDFLKRNAIQQQLYDSTMDTLENVLRVHGGSKAQIRAVKTQLKNSEKLIAQFQMATLREEKVNSDIVERICQHQQSALKTMETVCGLPETLDPNDEKKAFQDLNYEVIQFAATLYTESLNWMRAQVMAQQHQRQDEPPEIIEQDLYSAFYEYMKEASYGVTQDVLRRLVQCLGWGNTYSSYMRANLDREKIHQETKDLFNSLRKKSPGGLFDLADRLLYVADKLDAELNQMRSARLLTLEERGQVYTRQSCVMEWMAGMAMTGALGLYWCHGVKTRDQAVMQWNATMKNDQDNFDRLNATNAEFLTCFKDFTSTFQNMSMDLKANETSLFQLIANNELVLRNPHDSFKQIADAWVKTQGNQMMSLSRSTQRVLSEATTLFKRIAADRSDSKTGAGADAVGFFNPLREVIVSGNNLLDTKDIPADLLSIHTSFFEAARNISASMMERGLYKGKKFPTLSGPEGQSAFFRAKEERDWREIEERVVGDLRLALEKAEIQTQEHRAEWMQICLSNIASHKPGLAQSAAEAFVRANTKAKQDLETNVNAIGPVVAQMALEYEAMSIEEEQLAAKLATARQLVHMNTMEEKRVRDEYLNKYPGSPMSLATSLFLSNPWNVFKNTFQNAVNNTAGQEFHGTFYPIMEASWSQLMHLKRDMLNAWTESLTWWDALDGMAKFTSMAFSMVLIFNFFSTLTSGTASVAVMAFLALFIKNRIQSLDNKSFDQRYMEPHVRPHHSADSAQAVKTGWVRVFFGKTGTVLGFLWKSVSMATTTILVTSMMTAVISDFLRAIELFAKWWKATSITSTAFQTLFNNSVIFSSIVAGGSAAVAGMPEFVTRFGSALVHAVIGIPLMARVLPEKWWFDTGCWHKILTTTVVASNVWDVNWKWGVVYMSTALAGYWAVKKFLEKIDHWTPFYRWAKWLLKQLAKIPLAILPGPNDDETVVQEQTVPLRKIRRSRSRSKKRN